MARSLRIVLLAMVAAVGVATVTVALPARAAEMDKKAKADAKEAMRFYKEGNYDDAAKVFVKLSIAYPDMLVFVRNLGACYYYMRRYDPALSNLRDYVHRKKDIAPDDRAEVEGWIGEMERWRDQAAAAAAAPAPAVAPAQAASEPPAASAAPASATAPAAAVLPPAAPVAPVAPIAPPVVTLSAAPTPSAAPAGYLPAEAPPAYPQAPNAYPPSQGAPPQGYPSTYQAPQSYPPGYGTFPAADGTYPSAGVTSPPLAPQSQSSSGGARKTVAWILGAVGVGSVLAGVYCTVTALDRFSKVEKKYDPSVEKEGNNFAKAQWLGYGVGAALITTAIIVGASGGSSPSSSVALAPAVGPGSAGAVVRGSF